MRLSILMFVLLAASGCASPVPLSPSTGPWRFSGTVSGITGAGTFTPIAGAELTVIDGANINAKVTSGSAGGYAFQGLEGGRFTVAITAPGYVGITPVVELFRDTDANFALKQQ
jgi:hypothetical protein